MTKIVTATAVMLLAEGGKLDLDAPADEYFPRRAYKRF
jgi:CubicO group peptidase (beta-lactamase class C family)